MCERQQGGQDDQSRVIKGQSGRSDQWGGETGFRSGRALKAIIRNVAITPDTCIFVQNHDLKL